MGTGNPSLGLKRPECEAYHSFPSHVDIKNGGDVFLLPLMSSWSDDKLIKLTTGTTLLFYIYHSYEK
jgi:hypothetical protein